MNSDQNLIDEITGQFWDNCKLKKEFREKTVSEMIQFVTTHAKNMGIKYETIQMLFHIVASKLNGSIFLESRRKILEILNEIKNTQLQRISNI